MRSLCPLLGVWDKIPLGLSRRPSSCGRVDGTDYMLVVPLMPRFGRRYEINHDDFATGLWLVRAMLLIRVERTRPGFEVHVRWGSTPLRVTYENRGWPL